MTDPQQAIQAGDRPAALVRALEALHRSGLEARAVESRAGAPGPRGVALAELRGVAITFDEPGDDLAPARAIRRALADGGMRAAGVSLVAIEAHGERSEERARYAATRGLGRFAAGATVVPGEGAVALCVARIAAGGVGGAVTLLIDPIAGNLALAFGAPE